MPAARRPQLDDRRRLVIYSQRYSADAPSQGQRSPAVDAALRGARKPAAAYGWRVQRRLRARWFGVVPVRRRALIAVVTAIFSVVAALAVGHWASLWWPPVAMRPELARPLRLDRPDSFGTWLGAVMMAAAAGGSLMVYQLRRYRADDYHGHYRLWRIAVVLCLLSSVDAVIHLVSWVGAAIDVVLAERDVLAGADWVRLAMTVGGAAFGLRMTVELARSRAAAATMVLSLGLFGLASATRWNLLRMDGATAATWLPVALMVARAAFLTAVVVYLRMLYREVRKLKSNDRLAERLRKIWGWNRRSAAETAPRVHTRRAAKPEEQGAAEEDDDGESMKSRWRSGAGRRRFRFPFGGRRAAGGPIDEASSDERLGSPEEPEQKQQVAERRKFRLPFRVRLPFRGRQATAADVPEVAAANRERSTADAEPEAEDRPVRRGLFGLLRRRSGSEDAGDVDREPGEGREAAASTQQAREPLRGTARPGSTEKPNPAIRPSTEARPAAEEMEDDGEGADGETGDWETLNKSERRRARKLLKRQGKAA